MAQLVILVEMTGLRLMPLYFLSFVQVPHLLLASTSPTLHESLLAVKILDKPIVDRLG